MPPTSQDFTLLSAGPAPDVPPPYPQHIAGYRILEPIGEGGMGRVFRAHEEHPPRDVALKIVRGIDHHALTRFRREAELLASLEHPGIARLYASGEADIGGMRLPWLAMEYVRGSDLIAHASQQHLDLAARVRLLVDVCAAVQFAHGRGVIHRDLKPGNILVDERGQVRVLDFGIARLREAGDQMTQTGQVLGTLPYMSPEQLAGGAGQVDVRSDVYALGAIAYELIGGRLPHPRLSTSTLFEALDIIRRDTPQNLAAVAPAARGDLERVVMKALASDPARRYSSSAAFGDDLQRVLDRRPVEARAPTLGYLASRFVRRHRALSAAAAAVLVILVGASVVSLRYALSEAAARGIAEQRAAEAAAVSAFLEDMLTSADPEQALGRDLRVLDVLEQAAAGLQRESSLPTLVAGRLQRTLGRVYLKLGDGARAADLFAESRQQLQSLTAEDVRLRTGMAIDAIEADLAQERAEAAGQALTQLLDGPDVLDAEQHVVARLLQSQAEVAQGRLEAAETLLREVTEQAEHTLGPEHPQTLTAHHNLAAVLQARNQLEEAAVLSEHVLARRTQAFGAEHPETLYSMNHLSAVYQLMGDTARAEPLMKQTHESRLKVLGATHPSTLNTQGNLAVLYIQSGRLDQGVPLVEHLVEAWRGLRGEHAGKTLSAKQMLAYVYQDMGREAEAEGILRAIVATQVAEGGPTDPALMVPRNDLAMLLMNRGELDAALAEFDGLMPWGERLVGVDHPYLAIFAGNRGECLARLGRLADAQVALEGSHAKLSAAFGAQHARTQTGARRLADVYRRQGQPGRASAVLAGAGVDTP